MSPKSKLIILLMPSWIVNFIAISFALLLMAGSVVLTNYEGSELRQQVFEYNQSATASSDSAVVSYQGIGEFIAGNQYLSALPLLITWAGVGLVVYYFATGIMQALSRVAATRDQMNYVHASRNQLLANTFISLAIRLAAVIGWVVFVNLSLDFLVPYAMYCANIAAVDGLNLSSVGYFALGTAVLYVMVYIHAVFLRLVLLKPRVFGL